MPNRSGACRVLALGMCRGFVNNRSAAGVTRCIGLAGPIVNAADRSSFGSPVSSTATLAGTLDVLLAINPHARDCARAAAAAFAEGGGNRDRLYEMHNGNRIDACNDSPPAFLQLKLIEPRAQTAFDPPARHVEQAGDRPPDDCVPHGGPIMSAPAQPGRCIDLSIGLSTA
ncbi:MAG: hypothetical protein J2P48_04540 [Alphaproteobacteria bacterium]|nr:hypothetical protein [Alphaproteobacteria bacterium]